MEFREKDRMYRVGAVACTNAETLAEALGWGDDPSGNGWKQEAADVAGQMIRELENAGISCETSGFFADWHGGKYYCSPYGSSWLLGGPVRSILEIYEAEIENDDDGDECVGDFSPIRWADAPPELTRKIEQLLEQIETRIVEFANDLMQRELARRSETPFEFDGLRFDRLAPFHARLYGEDGQPIDLRENYQGAAEWRVPCADGGYYSVDDAGLRAMRKIATTAEEPTS